MVFYCIDSSDYILYSEIKIRSTFGIYRPYFSYQLGTNNNSLCFMSQVLASGIDMGNLVTLSAVFQTNERAIVEMWYLGVYSFRSEIYFDNGNRLTGTAAKVLVGFIL